MPKLPSIRANQPYWFATTIAVVTATALFGFHKIVGDADAARFSNATEAVQDNISVRLDAYVTILKSTRSLFSVHGGDLDVGTFRRFVGDLDVERRYPGIQGVGFTRRMARAEVDGVLESVRRQGQEPFALWPEHPRDEYHAILFLEPLDRRNRAALGYDMFTDTVRREAMIRARDTGAPAASGRVTLVQEIDPQKQSGFLIYVPVYRTDGSPPADVETRRERLVGFVYSPFRVGDLVQGIFGSQREPRVAFDLYDGTEASASHLMHRGIGPGAPPGRFAALVRLDAAGQPWTLRVVSTPAFDAGSSHRFFPTLLGLGLLVNLAIFFATRARVRAQREEEAAHRRLALLAETSKRFAEAPLDVPSVLETVCQEVAERLTESCTVTLLDADGRHLELAKTVHLDKDAEESVRSILERAPIPVGETSLGRVVESGEPVLLPVVERERLLASSRPEHREHLERFPLGSLLVVPLRVGERIIGTMTVTRRPGLPPFNAKDQELLQELADRAAVTLENARLAGRLQQAVQLRDEFVSVAGHELRTPLAALQLQVQGLLIQASKGSLGPLPPKLVERLNKAQAQVGRLDTLVAGLLDVSRIAAGRLMLDKEEVDLAGLASEVVDRFGDHVARGASEISIEASHRVVGHWDRMRLDQVLTNLVSNALKYGAGAPIQIRIESDGERARLAVHDQGIGISAEDRSRIFGRFERAVSERNYGGLGLGLWISWQIVKAHGGDISVESEIGEGSTFIVELPLELGNADAPG